MQYEHVVVDGYAYRGTDPAETFNLRCDAWGLAYDQRMFGPRRLLVAFALPDGTVISIAHTERLDPPEESLDPCIRSLGLGAALAIAFCDEPVAWGPPPAEVGVRFARAREIASLWGVHLVDWFACDDDLIRSSRLATMGSDEWWDAPPPRS